MATDMHRKIELQAPADFTYLHANTVALSRQKLDLHLPPSANPDDGPDPMRERVRELVDDFILRTFTSASSSISINGLDSSSPQFPFPAALTAPAETVEYEAYDGRLASRLSSLYAQLESLTTTVAQLRRDAPRRAAEAYSKELQKSLEADDEDDDYDDVDGYTFDEDDEEGADMQDAPDAAHSAPTATTQTEKSAMDVQMRDADDEQASKEPTQAQPQSQQQQQQQQQTATRSTRSRRKASRPDWKIHVPLGTDHEAERWRNGEMAEVYEDALRTLLRLQGEVPAGDEAGSNDADDAADGNALASTVGKAERAARAVDVVEKK